jgi:uncharacterized protein (DUF1501 family)
MKRRDFLKSALGLPLLAPFASRLVFADTPRPRTLVWIFLRGALDGLSAVIPYGESRYFSLRPSIALPAPGTDGGALNLDGSFALHPQLAPLLPLWERKELALIHACGSPDPTRSHFDAQDFMETGTPGVKSTTDGWLNRYLQHVAAPKLDLRALSLTQTLPRAMQGAAATLAVQKLSDFSLRTPLGEGSFEAMYAGSVDRVLRGTFPAVHELERVGKVAVSDAYPKGRLGEALRQIAQLVRAEVGLEIAFTDAGGFDTHVRQGASTGQLSSRLSELGQALATFAADMGGRLRDVCVVVSSEFGRTVRENGNGGTDHGHGNVMFVLGGAVSGGHVHGHWPGLDAAQLYEGRDLAITTDFRSTWIDILRHHLRFARAAELFPEFTALPDSPKLFVA